MLPSLLERLDNYPFKSNGCGHSRIGKVVKLSGQQTYYEILNVSPEASREDIELACLGLWYKYKVMRTTPLWQDLSRQIEEIHATLSTPETRTAYNRYLLNPSPDKHWPISKTEAANAVIEHVPSSAPRPPAVKLRKVFSFNATGGALLFNGLVSHIRPEQWSDLSSLGVLSLFFSIAGTFLIWSVANLLPARLPAEATIVEHQHAT